MNNTAEQEKVNLYKKEILALLDKHDDIKYLKCLYTVAKHLSPEPEHNL